MFRGPSKALGRQQCAAPRPGNGSRNLSACDLPLVGKSSSTVRPTKQPKDPRTTRFGPHRAGPRGPQRSNGGGLMSDRGNNKSSAAATLETVSEKPLPEFARLVFKPCPPSVCDMHNPQETQMPHFPRVSRGFLWSATMPLENTPFPIDVENGRKTRKKLDFGQVRARMPRRWHASLDAGTSHPPIGRSCSLSTTASRSMAGESRTAIPARNSASTWGKSPDWPNRSRL